MPYLTAAIWHARCQKCSGDFSAHSAAMIVIFLSVTIPVALGHFLVIMIILEQFNRRN